MSSLVKNSGLTVLILAIVPTPYKKLLTARYVLLFILKWSPSEEERDEPPDTACAYNGHQDGYPDKLFVGEGHAARRASI
jgi:hypothetical protein